MTSPLAAYPSTTMLRKNGPTRRSSCSLCLVSSVFVCVRVSRIFRRTDDHAPGAFTPGCSARHLPGFIDNLSNLRAKGVDVVAVIAFNDPFVMSAWGKANNIKGDDIVSPPADQYDFHIRALCLADRLLIQLFLSDPDAKFSKSIGWADTSSGRTQRFVITIDHGKVIYSGIETEKGVIQVSHLPGLLSSSTG